MARAILKRAALPALRIPKVPRLPDPNEPDVFDEMTLQEHLEELRSRIVKTCISIGIAFIGGVVLAGPVLRQIVDKAKADQSGLDIGSPTDPIAIYFRIALYIAIAITAPIIMWHLIGFLAPGLTKKEKRVLFSSLPFVSLLFLSGVAYAFFFAAPRAFEFLSGFQSDIFSWDPDGSEVINFYLTLMIGLGLSFQIPIVMFLLAKLGIVSARRMSDYRRYAAIALLVVSAVITPSTDPINMAFVAFPLLLLYEIGLLAAKFLARPKPSVAA